MMPTSGRRFSLLLVTALVLVLGGTVFLSWFRKAPARHVVPGSKGTAASKAGADIPVERVAKPPPPRSDYLGSAACAACHPKIARQYASHPMAKSMAEVATAAPLEDYVEKTTFTTDERHVYQVEQTATGVKHHERLLDAEGKLLYDQSEPVEYAVGSGAHGKSYLLLRGGTMFMSPISWYSKAHRWNLSPGYKPEANRRFERRITAACLDCHVGRANFVRGEENHLGQPPFPELSIGCERCHGPGGGHVAFRRAKIAPGDIDPIINPAKLEPARREDVCAQCHLQGEGRIPNYGCEIGDYRPGQRLEETAVVFVKGTRLTADGKSRAVSHVDQMRSSRCHQKSGGKFGCTSCHDPHSMPAESDKDAFYREKCLSCHQQQQPGCSLPEPERRKRQADDSCAACHMPPLLASDIPHTSHTDHRILRIPAAMPADVPTKKELPVIFDAADQRLPQWTVERARGLWLAEHAEVNSNPEMAELAVSLLTHVAPRFPDDANVFDGLGTASAVAGRLDESVEFWKQALALEPNRPTTIRTTAITLQNTKRLDEARPHLEKYLQLQPWDAAIWGRYSHVLGVSGHWQQALEAAKKSEAIDPSSYRVQQWLSIIHKELGDDKQRKHHEDQYERLKPPTPE